MPVIPIPPLPARTRPSLALRGAPLTPLEMYNHLELFSDTSFTLPVVSYIRFFFSFPGFFGSSYAFPQYFPNYLPPPSALRETHV